MQIKTPTCCKSPCVMFSKRQHIPPTDKNESSSKASHVLAFVSLLIKYPYQRHAHNSTNLGGCRGEAITMEFRGLSRGRWQFREAIARSLWCRSRVEVDLIGIILFVMKCYSWGSWQLPWYLKREVWDSLFLMNWRLYNIDSISNPFYSILLWFDAVTGDLLLDRINLDTVVSLCSDGTLEFISVLDAITEVEISYWAFLNCNPIWYYFKARVLERYLHTSLKTCANGPLQQRSCVWSSICFEHRRDQLECANLFGKGIVCLRHGI